jgi:hypothetical protein
MRFDRAIDTSMQLSFATKRCVVLCCVVCVRVNRYSRAFVSEPISQHRGRQHGCSLLLWLTHRDLPHA